jgi:hypothetical protein
MKASSPAATVTMIVSEDGGELRELAGLLQHGADVTRARSD